MLSRSRRFLDKAYVVDPASDQEVPRTFRIVRFSPL